MAAIGVIGAGTMGVGIAYVFAAAGFEAKVVEPDEARAEALRSVLGEQAAKGVERGKLTAEEAAALSGRVERLAATSELPEGLDLIVESVPERVELKLEILAAAEARRPRLLATNTSSISVDRLAAATNRPERLLGMHFFNPVWALRLVELIRGVRTEAAAITAAEKLVAAIGKESIVVRDVPGFATSRLDLSLALEAIRMVEAGVSSPEDIDRAAVLAYRHPVGPLRLSDIVGLDVRLDIARSLTASHGPRFTPPPLLERKVEAGELGEKSGRGFFDWR